MSELWTPERLRNAKMRCVLFADMAKGGYLQQYRFHDIPDLTVTVSAKTRRERATRTFYVGDMELPDDLQVVCDALNALTRTGADNE